MSNDHGSRWDWPKFTDRMLAGIPAVIALLLFIDPKRRAAQWIPAWMRDMNAEYVQNAYSLDARGVGSTVVE